MKEKLSERDFQDAARSLKCEVAVIKAVTEVESRGSGFLPDDQPVILFERHIFSRFTGRKYDRDHPDISNPKPGGYVGKAAEHERLARAVELNRTAALMSASWGLFQIMGFNHAHCGFSSLQKFINAMYRSEKDQLLAFVEFIKHNNLDDLLRAHRWAEFAKRYNGPAYKKNRYDEKLAAAYKKHAGPPASRAATARALVAPGYQGQVRAEWLVQEGADREMRLLEDFSFTDSESYTWRAVAGDIIDGASIPQFLWSFVGSPFVGDYRRASVLHDVACQKRDQPSRDVHRMFYEAMLADGFPEFSAQTFYTAVRLFGPQWELDQGVRAMTAARKPRQTRIRSFAEIEAAIDVVLGE